MPNINSCSFFMDQGSGMRAWIRDTGGGGSGEIFCGLRASGFLLMREVGVSVCVLVFWFGRVRVSVWKSWH